jgi:hypothetical protein
MLRPGMKFKHDKVIGKTAVVDGVYGDRAYVFFYDAEGTGTGGNTYDAYKAIPGYSQEMKAA